ncbi:MAG: prepilin-type N-terminal cleavage/methylation domain-containing protein [Patescibacteria group bacterium]|nr:prepilin-type N-terminal cleavage/methylation domain-containing protein [Patescibacteria group bacterium]
MRRRQKGYTIIEVVISLFIIGAVLVIYAAASNSIVLNRSVKYQELAHYIAVSELEDLQAAPFSSIPSSGPFSHSLLGQLPQGSANLEVSDYSAKVKQVKVTVGWQEPGRNAHNVALTTLMVEGGI